MVILLTMLILIIVVIVIIEESIYLIWNRYLYGKAKQLSKIQKCKIVLSQIKRKVENKEQVETHDDIDSR
ncbi:hypothetical protein [Bacillus rubiinfantis]|uniref:hypothetical protein n=1 Tax=Bacillus rubiinfantis TaxID=1499680 RepID=UPI0005AB4E6B|nr:hypothetical protein [Bacillus rubiinfantis]